MLQSRLGFFDTPSCTWRLKFLKYQVWYTIFLTLHCLSEGKVSWHHACKKPAVQLQQQHAFNSHLSGTSWVSRYQKGKTVCGFTVVRDGEWQRHQLGGMQICTSTQTDNHTSTLLLSLLQAGCPSCHPAYSVKALKAMLLLQPFYSPLDFVQDYLGELVPER